MYKNQMPEIRTAIPESDLLMYKVAHDLRAPLMSVKALIDMVRNDSEKQNLTNYLNLIEQSIDRMKQSIDQMIHSSKNEEPITGPQPVDIKKIAQEAIQSIRFMAIQRFVRIELLVDQKETFFSEEQPLKSIFTNLLSNAIRYRDETKLSSVYLHITFDHNGAHILFKDNGIGIEESLLDKIFAKFFRVNHEVEGSGLGLFIVKSAVESLGGTIDVKSRLGQGTTFTIWIPNRNDKIVPVDRKSVV